MDFGGKSWVQPSELRKPGLLDQVRIACRQKHFSHRTEKYYVYWIRQFILFNGKRHPSEMGQQEIEGYLNHLAPRRSVSASIQSGALNAIVFLYRTVLQKEIPELDNLKRIKRYKSIPVVMLTQEVAGTDIRTIQTLLEHKNVETTMIYTHITPDHKHVCSPIDPLKGLR